MESASSMIAIERLSKTFETSRGTSHLALTDISLDVAQGEFVSVLGPSGCGKSTLLYIVGGFVTPSAGALRVAGKPVTGPGPDRGPVFQEFALFPWKTVLGNVMYGLLEQGKSKAEAEARAQRADRAGASEGLREFLSQGALRRHEAARRDRAHARLRAEHPADGRAVRRARRAHAHRHADRAARHLGARPQDRAVRHPQRRGGGVPVRPRRGADALARPHQDRSSTSTCRARAAAPSCWSTGAISNTWSISRS